jgi:hypothetical protein
MVVKQNDHDISGTTVTGQQIIEAAYNKNINPTGNSLVWFFIMVVAPAGYLNRYA